MVSIYYQVTVKKSECWYFTAILRSFEHISFDRTVDKQNSIFEVLVANGYENIFLEIMDNFKESGVITDLIKLPNRLSDLNETI